MRNLGVVTALALIGSIGCAHEDESEAVEPETTSTSGGVLREAPGPQASAPVTPSSARFEERSTQQQYGAYRDPSASNESAPQVSDEVPANAALQGQVRDALRRDARIDGTTIAVNVEGASVYLDGYVTSEQQRTIAHDIVAQLPGVSHVFTHDLRVGS